MNPIVSAFIAKLLLRLVKVVNRGAIHDYAEKLKKEDIEAGYDTYKK